MSKEKRTTATATATKKTMMIVIATVVTAIGIGIATAAKADRPPTRPARPAVPSAAAKPSMRELDQRDMGRLPGELTPADEREVANALGVAHRFLDAYMRWQAGEDSKEITATFRATAIDYMFEDLMAEPSVPRSGPYHLIRFNPELAGPAWIIVQGAYGDEHDRAPFALWLRKSEGRWQVTSDQIRQSQ